MRQQNKQRLPEPREKLQRNVPTKLAAPHVLLLRPNKHSMRPATLRTSLLRTSPLTRSCSLAAHADAHSIAWLCCSRLLTILLIVSGPLFPMRRTRQPAAAADTRMHRFWSRYMEAAPCKRGILAAASPGVCFSEGHAACHASRRVACKWDATA